MLELKLIHVSKRDPWWFPIIEGEITDGDQGPSVNMKIVFNCIGIPCHLIIIYIYMLSRYLLCIDMAQ